jgi:penicillin-binding protein 1B
MAQVYQFLASGGQIQPLRAVRGVLDPKGKAVRRYDFDAEPAKEGDAIAARLVTLALQDAVTRGTGRPLLADGLGPLRVAGKTGTSNDSRDSWFAGYTGDHLAVVWVGNDKNEPTGLYGSTGAMRVWSALFTQLPSAPLNVGAAGLEYGWVDANTFATTEENCEGARRYAFVAGYLPPEHVSCVERSWLDWFRFGGDDRGERRPDQGNEQ